MRVLPLSSPLKGASYFMTKGKNIIEHKAFTGLKTPNQKGKFKFPPSLVFLFLLLILISILTYVIPAGEFERIKNPETGRMIVVADSYQRVEQSPVGPFKLFVKIINGFVAAADISFLIMFGAAWIFAITRGGAFDGGIKALIRKTRGREQIIIPLFFFVFALAGATYGEYNTVYGLIPLFVGIAIALGWDPIVGFGMSMLAVCAGFSSGVYNPYTVGIAHKYAELPLFSGSGFRWVAFVLLCSLNCWWVMRYAKKIKADPSSSLVADIDYSDMTMKGDDSYEAPFTLMHKFQLVLLVLTIFVIVGGTLKYDWYFSEISGIFLLMFIINELLNKRSAEQIAVDLTADCASMMSAVLVVGISRGVLQVISAGKIVDTIIYALNAPLTGLPVWAAAEGMLVVQNLLNFFIPSGSGQATAIMPIMTPLADLTGVSRQVAVLAYHFGDGFSNMIWPTASITITAGIAKIPLDRWWRFYLPCFALTFFAQAVLIAVAVAIGYK